MNNQGIQHCKVRCFQFKQSNLRLTMTENILGSAYDKINQMSFLSNSHNEFLQETQETCRQMNLFIN